MHLKLKYTSHFALKYLCKYTLLLTTELQHSKHHKHITQHICHSVISIIGYGIFKPSNVEILTKFGNFLWRLQEFNYFGEKFGTLNFGQHSELSSDSFTNTLPRHLFSCLFSICFHFGILAINLSVNARLAMNHDCMTPRDTLTFSVGYCDVACMFM